MKKRKINDFIPIVKDYYWIYENGDVYSEYSHRNLTKFLKRGYYQVNLMRYDDVTPSESYSIHRLLMIAFRPVENMEKLQVNHKDGNKLNNNFDNMEWVTLEENIKHAWKTGLLSTRKGVKSNFSKLTEDDIKNIFSLREQGFTQQAIADQVGCTRSNISYILNKKTWQV